MRRGFVSVISLIALFAAGCASSREDDALLAATFRRGEAIEFYDWRLGVSHAGGHAGAMVRDCSSDEFHCRSGVTVIIAPRDCSDLRRLIRRGPDWRVNDQTSARLLFLSERQLYFASDSTERDPAWRSNGAAGFVYDVDRGVIGVWRSQAALRMPLDEAAMAEIVDSTKWLEAPQTLFRCR